MENKITIAISKEVHDKVKVYSNKTGIKIRRIIENAILEYLNSVRSGG